MSSPRLERAMGLPHATAMVVGTIIAASIFVQPSEIARHVPSVPGMFLVWFIAGLLSLFGALVCAELASTFTQTGGVYVYLREAFSPAFGFLWGWTLFWTIHSGIIAAIALVCARYLAYFIPIGESGMRAAAVAVIVFLSAVNYIGVRYGSTLQSLFTLGKLIAIAGIVVLGAFLGSRAAASPPAEGPLVSGTGEFISAIIAGIFAFGGWHMVTFNAEETINPRKTIPRALIIGMLIVMASYIALNAVYVYVLPLDKVVSSTRIAADAADAILGFGGGATMAGLVVFSTFGALAGIILSGPRVYFAMARDGLLFQWLCELHPKYHTPHRSILVQAVWCSVLAVTGTYRGLFTRVVYIEWIFFGVMTVGLILLRRRPDLAPAYRVWGYPLVPILFILSTITIAASRIWSNPLGSLGGLTPTLIGLPVYWTWRRYVRRPQPV